MLSKPNDKECIRIISLSMIIAPLVNYRQTLCFHRERYWNDKKILIINQQLHNSHPVKVSVDKGKKQSERGCNNYHGVADLAKSPENLD